PRLNEGSVPALEFARGGTATRADETKPDRTRGPACLARLPLGEGSHCEGRRRRATLLPTTPALSLAVETGGRNLVEESLVADLEQAGCLCPVPANAIQHISEDGLLGFHGGALGDLLESEIPVTGSGNGSRGRGGQANRRRPGHAPLAPQGDLVAHEGFALEHN